MPVALPVALAASAAESELPPIELPVAPFEPPSTPFESGPVDFEPSPAFGTIEPLPSASAAPALAEAQWAEPAPAGTRPEVVGSLEGSAPVVPSEPAEPAPPVFAAVPIPEGVPWFVPGPMRLTEPPPVAPEVEPEFAAPSVSQFGGPPLATFEEPEGSPFSEPPIPAFADLGDPFQLSEAAIGPIYAAPEADVFAVAPEAAPHGEMTVAAGTEPAGGAEGGFAETEFLESPAFGEPAEAPAVPAAVPEPIAETTAVPTFFAAARVEEEAAPSPFDAETAGPMPSPEAIAEAERAASVAIQRIVPRALAQYGEVRELEIEVPVPSVWVGGKRMTLQLRLTLVPQEEEPGG